MIKEIIMKNVASYKEETKLDTENKRINLIYGLNGTGKSTISDFLHKQHIDNRFKDCKIDGFEDATEKILVYNKTFVEDYFYEDLKGIFTLSKENKDSIQKINKAKAEKNVLEEQKKLQEENKKEEKSKFEEDKSKKQDSLWKNVINRYQHKEFDYCLSGYKASKDSFFNYIIKIPKTTSVEQIEELKKNITLLKDNDTEIKELEQIIFDDIDDIEKSDIFNKIIVGNTNSSFGKFIEKLKNSDWVKKGFDYLNEDNKCPFCQQEISQELIKNLNKVFDEEYNKDIEHLKNLLDKYNKDISKIDDKNLKIYKDNTFIREKLDTFCNLIKDLKKVTDENKKKIEEKIKTPNLSIALSNTKKFLQEVNIFINEINTKIREHNKKIKNIEDTREEIKKEFWNIVRNENDYIINDYNIKKNEYDKEMGNIDKKIEELQKKINDQKRIISEESLNTINIEKAIEYINSKLVSDFGITSFTIVKKEGTDNLYQLKRENEDCEFKTLSEGEKMVITFLYFCQLCEGQSVREEALKDKIVVIDDPISSLSHIWVFNISYLIKNLFINNKNYKQVFLMTHNLYFFYEILKHIKSKDEFKNNYNLHRLKRNKNSSKIEPMGEDIKNDYHSYWDIIKDSNSSPALLANCMRQIMEYFFGFVENKEYHNVFQKEPFNNAKYHSFCRYMNRESHSDMQNIFDLKDFDYENYKEAFRLVFETNGYEEHYKKMME